VTPALAALTLDFLERARDELPARLHTRELDAGGAPEWSRGFSAYLSDNGSATAIVESQDFCNHPTLTDAKAHCPTCDDSGLRVRVRHVHRHPMKSALTRLSKMPVPFGRPRFDKVLWALLVSDGNLGMVRSMLSAEYACMGDEAFAERWTATALLKLRRVYREDVGVYRGISENQAIAEAA